MKSRLFFLLLVLGCLAQATTAHAEDTIPDHTTITNAMMVGVGTSNLLDTYLSPEQYKGEQIRYLSHVTRQRPGRLWNSMVVWQGSITSADNRAENNTEMAGMLNFSYGRHRKWTLMGGQLDLQAGALIDTSLGFIYNTRNSNNPAQAKLRAALCPSGIATYRFSLWDYPLTLRYELAAPLVGVMFSPNYGQSYYEIFSEGDYDHNVVPTTIFSTPSLRHALTLDFNIQRLTVRVGYMGDYQQSDVNHLKFHSYSHMLVIGFVRKFQITNIIP